ncbi:MAG TPA: hypothetical protein VM433_01630 [Mycobacteriales bacterium]|nr:hypothetical protein [Mycobacteriales bacterium]
MGPNSTDQALRTWGRRQEWARSAVGTRAIMTGQSNRVPGATDAAAPALSRICCQTPMNRIQVTTRGADLALYSCVRCSRHRWERDGQEVQHTGVIDGVNTFLEQPRERTPRRRTGPQAR